MLTIITIKYVILIILVTVLSACVCANDDSPFRLSLTISARYRRLEVSWWNLRSPSIEPGYIVITDTEPLSDVPFRQVPRSVDEDDMFYVKLDVNSTESSSGPVSSTEVVSARPEHQLPNVWTYDGRPVRYWLRPEIGSGWHTTTVTFDYEAHRENVTIATKCYGFWATYVTDSGERLLSACVSAYPTWMNDMKSHIGNFKVRDLFLMGTHDSGSYRPHFDPRKNETLVTKYSITQDDDIYTQLMHGVRYLDIRVAYYRSVKPVFWVNHGISRQQTLHSILQQVRDFVQETNEIIIFDVQEFPVGFRKLETHRSLVHYIQSEIGDLMVDYSLTWDATMNDIWKSKRNIIVGYDYLKVMYEFPLQLWMSVQQRWGNVQNVPDLKRYLAPAGREFVLFSSRPIAEMAELTPTTWDVITDALRGLRVMADQTNRQVSRWYIEEWGPMANIVAVDFMRGTNLMETSLYWNAKKDVINNND